MNSTPELKSVIGTIIDRIISLIKFKNIRDMVDESISVSYYNGLDKAEEEFNMNLNANHKNLSFLKEYTFDNIKGMNDELENKLRQEIQRGILNSDSIPNIKENVKKIMNVSEFRANAIARTETARAENMGHLDGAKDSGLVLKKYLLITNDERTSNISKAMGEKYGSPEKAISLDEKFHVVVNGKVFEGQAPPFHVHDRDQILFEQVLV